MSKAEGVWFSQRVYDSAALRPHKKDGFMHLLWYNLDIISFTFKTQYQKPSKGTSLDLFKIWIFIWLHFKRIHEAIRRKVHFKHDENWWWMKRRATHLWCQTLSFLQTWESPTLEENQWMRQQRCPPPRRPAQEESMVKPLIQTHAHTHTHDMLVSLTHKTWSFVFTVHNYKNN